MGGWRRNGPPGQGGHPVFAIKMVRRREFRQRLTRVTGGLQSCRSCAAGRGARVRRARVAAPRARAAWLRSPRRCGPAPRPRARAPRIRTGVWHGHRARARQCARGTSRRPRRERGCARAAGWTTSPAAARVGVGGRYRFRRSGWTSRTRRTPLTVLRGGFGDMTTGQEPPPPPGLHPTPGPAFLSRAARRTRPPDLLAGAATDVAPSPAQPARWRRVRKSAGWSRTETEPVARLARSRRLRKSVGRTSAVGARGSGTPARIPRRDSSARIAGSGGLRCGARVPSLRARWLRTGYPARRSARPYPAADPPDRRPRVTADAIAPCWRTRGLSPRSTARAWGVDGRDGRERDYPPKAGATGPVSASDPPQGRRSELMRDAEEPSRLFEHRVRSPFASVQRTSASGASEQVGRVGRGRHVGGVAGEQLGTAGAFSRTCCRS